MVWCLLSRRSSSIVWFDVYCKDPVPWCGVSSLGDLVPLCGVVSTVKIQCHGVVSIV